MIRLSAKLRHPLAREIVVVLAVKAAALALLYFAFFAPPHRPEVTPAAMDRLLFGIVPAITAPPAHGRTDRDV